MQIKQLDAISTSMISHADAIKKLYDEGIFSKILKAGRDNTRYLDLSGVDKDRLVSFFMKKPEFNHEFKSETYGNQTIESHEFISDEFDIEILDHTFYINKIPQNESLILSDAVNELLESTTPRKMVVKESLSESVVILAVDQDGSRKYYDENTDSWVDKASDGTIYEDPDKARMKFYDIDKSKFRRVFVPNYDPKIMEGTSTTTCKSCGKPYDVDGRCYNIDCDQYDPISQYFDDPEDDLSESLVLNIIDESKSLNESGYKITIEKDDETFIDYCYDYREESAIAQMKSKYGDNIKIVSIEEHNKVEEDDSDIVKVPEIFADEELVGLLTKLKTEATEALSQYENLGYLLGCRDVLSYLVKDAQSTLKYVTQKLKGEE